MYPTPTKNNDDASEWLCCFCDKIGVPANLKSDMATTFAGHHTDFQSATFLLDTLRARNQSHCGQTENWPIGIPQGKYHPNPLLDTQEYEVELEDRTYDSYFANTIAENQWSQCDTQGWQFNMICKIVCHKMDGHAIPISEGTYMVNSQQCLKKTTAGWKINVEFSDGTSDWLPLRNIKESNPIDLAEYTIASQIVHEPVFKWWVLLVMQKWNQMIKKVKKKYWKTTNKYRIWIPKTVAIALRFDKAVGTNYWSATIQKEVNEAKVAYIAIDGATPEQVTANQVEQLHGFQEIKCHIIFDVKMDFTWKARYAAGGHMTETPNSLTYLSVVSWDCVKSHSSLLPSMTLTYCHVTLVMHIWMCHAKKRYGLLLGLSAGTCKVYHASLFGHCMALNHQVQHGKQCSQPS